MSRKNAELLLILAIALRASSLLFSKIGLASLQPFTLLGIRFLAAFVILAVIFHHRLASVRRKTILHSMIIGGTFAVVMSFELYALETTPSSVTAFLENTAIVFVPLLLVPLQRKLPSRATIISCATAIGGVFFMTFTGSSFSFTWGELLAVAAAVSYASAIILTGKYAKEDDPLQIGILQNGFIGLFTMMMAFLFEKPALPSDSTSWICLIALVMICSVLGFTIQPVAQRYLDDETAGLFCGLNPLIASVLGIIFLGERLQWNGFLGAALILAAIILSHLIPDKDRSARTVS